MSLKVLLADESSTIKKVFQLALQDYAVEVISVHSGEDVIPIAQKTNPDIIFIDILLQKKSGYDVACEVKQLPQFANTHIVLMWSSFLTLDQDKFQASLATAHIEKPFEIQSLRALINQLVPKTQSQKLSNFLQMPDLPKEVQEEQKPSLRIAPENPPPPVVNEDFEEVSLDIQLKTDSFKELNNNEQDSAIITEDETEPAWVSKSLGESRTDNFLSPELDIPEEEIPFDEVKTKIDTVVSEQLMVTKNHNLQTPSIKLADDTETSIEAIPIEEDYENEEVSGESIKTHLSREQIESIVRQEARSIIEEAVWKIVPEVATQLIEKEIKRLTDNNKPGAV